MMKERLTCIQNDSYPVTGGICNEQHHQNNDVLNIDFLGLTCIQNDLYPAAGDICDKHRHQNMTY